MQSNGACGVIERGDDPIFDTLFKAYAQIFTLKSEQKPRDVMLSAMARNRDAAFQRQYGPCKEMWVYILSPDGKEVVGASNFDVFAGTPDPHIDGTLHGIFTFVNPRYRGNGVLKQLLQGREEQAKAYIRSVNPNAPEHPHILSFVEQNSPPLMTPEEWEQDIEATGTDPVVRRELYEKEGYRQLQLRYIQPPVGRRLPPCDFLDLCVAAAEGNRIRTDLVRHHIERFLALSFPNGTTLDHPTAKPMKKDLARQASHITLLPPGRFEHFTRMSGMRHQLSHVSGVAVHVPATRRGRPMGDIFHTAAAGFYGTQLNAHGDRLPRALRHAQKPPEVLIIGAGIAGLKAAHELRKQGISYRIIEAGGQVGGRAKTLYSQTGLPIDIGAHWGHNAKKNPLTEILDQEGIPYTIDRVKNVWTYRGGKNHGAALRNEADQSINWDKAKRILDGSAPDCALEELIDDPEKRAIFRRKYATWYGLDHDESPSAYEYLTDQGTPGGFQVTGGIGTLVEVLARKARADKHTLFHSPVTAIEQTAQAVTVTTDSGQQYTAPRAIITVPHAVLSRENIQFQPLLSEAFRSDLHQIANGRMTKVVMELRPNFFEEQRIPRDTHLFITDAEPPLFCHLHSGGKPTITMLIGGSKGSELEKLPAEKILAYVHVNLEQVQEIKGYKKQIIGIPYISQFSRDPYALGAYSVCRPVAKRSGPHAEEKLLFAGDTFDPQFPASMAGAYQSGKNAGRQMAEEIANERHQAKARRSAKELPLLVA